MTIAKSLKATLDGRGTLYNIVLHDPTASAVESARLCNVSEDNLAKGVLIRRKDGYVLAIVPASCQVELAEVGSWLNEPVRLATEKEVESVFSDCAAGSIPPIPAAYELQSVMDESLEGLQEIYFEGGDHCSLVHVNGREFQKLLHDVPHAHIGHRCH